MAREGKVTKIYREYVANLHSARAQAQEIVEKTPESERKLIDAIYLSPDAFQKRSEQDSFADQMGEIFRANGMPYPTPADDDRRHGAQLMYELMRSDELEVDPSCVKLREVIPMVCTEEDDPEEIEKFEGDDAFDSARYAVKSRERPGKMPEAERVEKRVTEYFKSKGKKLDDQDPDTIARITRRTLWLEQTANWATQFLPTRIFLRNRCQLFPLSWPMKQHARNEHQRPSRERKRRTALTIWIRRRGATHPSRKTHARNGKWTGKVKPPVRLAALTAVSISSGNGGCGVSDDLLRPKAPCLENGR